MHPEPPTPTPEQPNDGHERGASLVEYALLVALIALVAVVAVQFFGDQTSASFDSSATSLLRAN